MSFFKKIGNSFSDAGREIGKGAKDVGNSFGDAGREIGKGAKEVGRYAGKGAKTLEKVAGHTLDNAMKLQDALVDALTTPWLLIIAGLVALFLLTKLL
jgi:hypothetical protein